MSGEYEQATEAMEQEETGNVQPLVSVPPQAASTANPESSSERKMSAAIPAEVAAEISKVAKELRVPVGDLKAKVAELAFQGIDRAKILDLADQVYQETRSKLG